MTDPGTIGGIFAALYAAHQVADHWVQTEQQAATKGQPGWPGRVACLTHCATYTATAFAALAALYWATGTTGPAWRLGAGLAGSAVTHYIADRRTPLRRIADAVGRGGFYRVAGNGINGAYLLDQSWHVGWLFIAALVIA